jgi:hypothetical protein
MGIPESLVNPMISPSRRIRVVLVSLLSLLTMACGSGGGEGDAGPSKLFVADPGNYAIGSFADRSPDSGSRIDRIIVGPSTRLGAWMEAMDYDPVADRLYVSSLTSNEFSALDHLILVFDNAGEADGDVQPRRLVQESWGSFTRVAMQVDPGRDLLYLLDEYRRVSVYTQASTAQRASPARHFVDMTSNVGLTSGLAIDPQRNIAYVLGQAPPSGEGAAISRFSNASSLEGEVLAGKQILLNGHLDHNYAGLALDRVNDRLYAGVSGGIAVIENASGDAVETKRILLPAGVAFKLAIDPVRDRLYALDAERLYVIPNVSKATGNLVAKALLAPDNGKLGAVAVAP